MGLFDDFSQFLESRLEEFLKNHPHLEIQAIEEQLREQEQDTLRLIADLQLKEKQLQEEILAIAKDIQHWHARVSQAKQANRPDLAQAAEEREAALLRTGNQRWGQMQGVKQRLVQSKELLQQIQQRRKEVKVKADQVRASRAASTTTSFDGGASAWNQTFASASYSRSADPLEAKFQQLETDIELEKMKRNIGR